MTGIFSKAHKGPPSAIPSSSSHIPKIILSSHRRYARFFEHFSDRVLHILSDIGSSFPKGKGMSFAWRWRLKCHWRCDTGKAKVCTPLNSSDEMSQISVLETTKKAGKMRLLGLIFPTLCKLCFARVNETKTRAWFDFVCSSAALFSFDHFE